MTPEQYLEIERATEFRNEYLDGEMFAMAGATVAHNIVVNNLGRALRRLLKGRGVYFTSEIRLHIPSTGLYTYPDLMVILGEIQFSGDRQDTVINPGLIVEVLSESTADYDRGRKFLHYRAIPNLTDYLIVSQDSPRIEHHSRQNDGSWLLREYTSLAGVVVLPSISAQLSLAAVYEGIESESSTSPRPA